MENPRIPSGTVSPNPEARFASRARPTFPKGPDMQLTLIVALAAVMSIPIALGTTYNFTFFLAPLVALAFFVKPQTKTHVAFLAAGVGGLVSIAAANYVAPGNIVGDMTKLGMVLFVAGFYFVGRALRGNRELAIKWLAIWSSVFLVVAALPLLLSGGPVRALNPDGTVFVDVHFLGLPVYATYGINSLAPLFAVQAALICGAAYRASTPTRLLLGAGLMCAIFLIVGTESRSAQGSLLLLLPALIWMSIRHRDQWRWSGILAAVFCLGIVLSGLHGAGGDRLLASVRQALDLFSASPHNSNGTGELAQRIDDLTTNRLTLVSAAFDEWQEHPLIGIGFTSYGRYHDQYLYLADGFTPHFFPLTIIWLGGLVFAVPYVAFVAFGVLEGWKGRDGSPEHFFAAVAVLMLLTGPSVTWDIMLIPFAGSLGWLLLGLLGKKAPELSSQ